MSRQQLGVRGPDSVFQAVSSRLGTQALTRPEVGPVVQPIFRAQNSRDPAELDRLARTAAGLDRENIRMTVAENLHTGADTLKTLAGDAYSGTRWAVTRNPNTDPLTLDHLTRDLDPMVMDSAEDVTLQRCMVGPEHVADRWKRLAMSMSRDARLAADGEMTGRPTQLQFDAGQRLVERRYDRRRQHYALTSSSRILIDQFLLGGNATLRWMAAHNPHASRRQLEALEQDGRKWIALEAFKRLNQTRLAALTRQQGLPPVVREYLDAPGWKREQMEREHPHLVERIVGVSLEEDIKSRNPTQRDRTPVQRRKPEFVKAR